MLREPYIQNMKHALQSDHNINLEFDLILNLNPECEVPKTVSKGKLFHNSMTLRKKEAE